MARTMLWPVLTMLALCHGQLTREDEIAVLSEADEELMKQVKDTRRFINGQLIQAIEVIGEKAEKNKQQIEKLAMMTEKSLKLLSEKVQKYGQQLGESEELADVELPLLAASMAEGEAEQDQKIQHLAHVTTLLQMQQEADAKMENMMNRSHQRVTTQIAKLKAQVDETNQRLQQELQRNAAAQQSNNASTEAFQREAAKGHARDKKMKDFQTDLQRLEDAEFVNRRYDSELIERMSQLRENITAEMDSRSKWILMQELLLGLLLGVAFTAAHHVLRSIPKFRPSLQQPLLTPDSPKSDASFSIISSSAVPQPQFFLKGTAMRLSDGPPVAAEDLRPNCSVHAAMGGHLEVEVVTFKHVKQCDVIRLTLTGAQNLCITARQRVVRVAKEREVIPAMELREGDVVLFHGSCLKVQNLECQTLHNVELVEVVFDSNGAVETLADAQSEHDVFHIV